MQTLSNIFSIACTSVNDGFTDGGISDPVRRQHMTFKDDEIASFSLRAERRPKAPQPLAKFDRAASDLLSEQTRLSIFCWNPGPTRGSPGAIENHIVGRWHSVALQEAAELLQHEDMTCQFHVTHFRGCATFFNKHMVELDLEVKSIYVPADKAHGSGWASKAVVSTVRFRRIPRKGRSSFTIMSLHCYKAVAQKRSIA